MSDPKPPGRPPLDPDDPSVPLTFRLPSKQAEALYEEAARERLSFPEWARRVFQHAIDSHKEHKNR